MKHKPQQTRSRQKCESMLKAALEEFAENGYTATTTKTITDRAGVAAGSFYQFFENKDDILHTLVEQRYDGFRAQFEALNAEIPSGDSDRLSAAIRTTLELVLDFHAEMKGFHALIHHRRFADAKLRDILDGYDAFFLLTVSDLIRQFTDQNVELHAFVMASMAEGVIQNFVFNQPEFERADVLETTVAQLNTYLLTLTTKDTE